MSTWILVLIISSGYGTTMDHITFETQDDCQSGIKQFVSAKTWPEYREAFCLEVKHD